VLLCRLAGFFPVWRSDGRERSFVDIDRPFVQQLGRVLDLPAFHRYIACGKA
jgi:hypothetical protein